ncbi:MAG: GNAT family N-acetyltransferase [Bacteroidetes bacterium 4572_77]|nr:MAG: GNAT family N-acetyltransferase [Bacteroidetes bacterium 4572_77]
MQVQIKREKKKDFEEVDMLLKVAFERNSIAHLVQKLRESDAFIPELARVARINNQIIGVIHYSHIQIIKGKKIAHAISMAPLAVLPAYQNLGIGAELIRNSFAKAREKGFDSVIVMGHEEYYPRFGFKLASEYNITCPYDVPNENFMALELFPNVLNKVSGRVKYDPLFTDLPTYTI